jgi:hypothetical protein
MENNALYESARTGKFSVAVTKKLQPDLSRGNRTVFDKDGMHMFKPVRAHWQLNSCLLAAVRCTYVVSCVIGYVGCGRHRKVNTEGGEETTFD